MKVKEITPQFCNNTSVILVPGWGESLETLSHLADAIADRGFRVIAIDYEDLDGTLPQRNDVELKNIPSTEFIRALGIIRTLHKKKVGSVNIVAHSEGATSAILAAYVAPKRFSRMVLINPAGFMENDHFYLLSWRFILSLLQQLRQSDGRRTRAHMLYVAEMARYIFRNPVQVLRDALGVSSLNIIGLLTHLKKEKDIDIHVFHNSDDLVFPLEEVYRSALIAGIHRFHTYSGGHNEIYIEPSVFAGELVKILVEEQKTTNTIKSGGGRSKAVKFEYNTLPRTALNLLTTPVLNKLPASTRKVLRKTHRSADAVVENRTGHFALDLLYQEGKTYRSRNIFEYVFRKFWFNTRNAVAVRNRLRLVKHAIVNHLGDKIDDGVRTQRILSIASGSARAVIESINEFHDATDVVFDVTFLDKNPDAISYSQELAKLCDKRHSLRWVNDSVSNFFLNLQDKENKFDIVEMVGLLDYFDDERAVRTFKSIKNHLDKKGLFITANIDDNDERPFITNLVGWPMIYRSGEELSDLLIKSGFKFENIHIQYEPLHIHMVSNVLM